MPLTKNAREKLLASSFFKPSLVVDRGTDIQRFPDVIYATPLQV